MLKSLIQYLYFKICNPKPVWNVQVEDIEKLPVEEQNVIFKNCQEYTNDPQLFYLMQLQISKWENEIIYQYRNEPFKTTPAELRRQRIGGLTEFCEFLQILSAKLPTEPKEFDKHDVV